MVQVRKIINVRFVVIIERSIHDDAYSYFFESVLDF